MPKRHSLRSWFSLFSLFGLTSFCHAASSHPTDQDHLGIRFSGFGTLGAVHARADGATFTRDITQPKGADNRGLDFKIDSRLGVQLNYNVTNNIEAVAQIVSRYRHENDFSPEITWGFLKYTHDDMLELRLGRVGFDGYIGADTRDVGYSYLWARPPVDYYGTLLFPYQDGGDLVLRMPFMNGIARLKMFNGVTRQQVSSLQEQRQWASPYGPMSTPPIGSIQDLNKSRNKGAFIEYQNNQWTGRIGYSRLRLNKGFPAGGLGVAGLMQAAVQSAYFSGNQALTTSLLSLLNGLEVANKHTTYKTFELVYDDGPLKLQGAFARFTSDSLLIPQGHSAFVSAGYRYGQFTPYATASLVRTKSSSRPQELAALGANQLLPGVPLVDMTQFMLATPLNNQNSYALGLRYDFTDTVALKLQADFIRNKNCSPVALPGSGLSPCPPPLLWPTVPTSWNNRASVYSATLDFIF